VAAGAKFPRPEERLSIAERAFAHCRVAAEAGIAESCYKLGDFLRDGRGCDKDVDKAYQWYRRAYDVGKSDSPVYWGSAALRLGKAHEEGEGCTQSFQEAKSWYSCAVAGLSAAVREGESVVSRRPQERRGGPCASRAGGFGELLGGDVEASYDVISKA
jgi:hypothetical protein